MGLVGTLAVLAAIRLVRFAQRSPQARAMRNARTENRVPDRLQDWSDRIVIALLWLCLAAFVAYGIVDLVERLS